MVLSTSLNIYGSVMNRYTFEELIDRAIKCGFRNFDFNYVDYRYGDTFYTADAWRDNIKKLKDYAESKGAHFVQSHTHFWEDKNFDGHEQLVKSIEAAGIAQVPWAVLHPWDFPGSTGEEWIEKNISRARPYVAFAKEQGVGIALENVPQRWYTFAKEGGRDFGCCAEDLIALIDSLNAEFGNVGACWDTGHANLAKIDQKEELIKLGDRLKVTHIADNRGQHDDHMAPFYGNVDWKAITEALKAIDYQGTFNFETHYFTGGLPDELIDDGVALLYKIGKTFCEE